MLTNRTSYICGMIASAVYVVAVLLGGLLWPEYSHIRQPISELTFETAPNQWLIQPLFALYNFFLLVFSVGVFKIAKNKLIKVSASSLFLVGLSGLLMYFFPQDPMNTPLTFQGLMHFVLAGIAALGTIIAVFTAGFGLKSGGNFKQFSIVIGLVIIFSGSLTPLAVSNFSDYFGLFERTTIFSFILWLFIFSRKLFKEEL